MANKTKFGFGSSADLEPAIKAGKLNARDIVLLDENTDNPKIGWIKKNGEAVIVETDLSGIEAEIATKADAAEVDNKINEASQNTVATIKAYTDGKIEAAVNEHLLKKYEITHTPEGTLVDMREKEIRVMCPVGTQFVKQNVGPTGSANYYYMAFKAYAPEGAVSFKEGDRGVIVDKMYTFDDDFAGVDQYGRSYSICWLALASYDENSNTWTYFGSKSTNGKYVGWDYVIEWYDAKGVVIASDCIRINLSNENCHSSIEPYYIAEVMKEVDTKINTKFAEVESAYEIIEF